MAETAQQPGPVADLWEWQYQGACRTASPEVFFHPEGERGPARRRRDERAKQVCGTCPVLLPCREQALSAREPYGVWGGMTEDERQAYHDAVDAGRPPVLPPPPHDPGADAPSGSGTEGPRTEAS